MLAYKWLHCAFKYVFRADVKIRRFCFQILCLSGWCNKLVMIDTLDLVRAHVSFIHYLFYLLVSLYMATNDSWGTGREACFPAFWCVNVLQFDGLFTVTRWLCSRSKKLTSTICIYIYILTWSYILCNGWFGWMGNLLSKTTVKFHRW